MTFIPPADDNYRIENRGQQRSLRRFVSLFRLPGRSIELPFVSPTSTGVTPLQMLRQTLAGMTFANEHYPELAGPNAAKATASLIQTIAILEGRETETSDGFPIIGE